MAKTGGIWEVKKMKVVFFCGGQGMRLYPSTGNIPKPLVAIGDHPILWNLMKYYSYYGQNEFILCLGYKGGEIKKYFVNYNEALSNDFVLTEGGKIEVISKDIEKWNITFSDTGLQTNTGERLKKIKKYVGDDEWFMVNYADALTDLNLQELTDYAIKRNKIGCLITVSVPQSFHVIYSDRYGYVKQIERIEKSELRINGGFFIFKNEIFDLIEKGEDIIEALKRLAERQELVEYKYDGFWASMDTYKDKARLDKMAETGKAPWEIWK
jgi:glucose-1-phosphate cytidylyltransferase